mgnify:CR=1 FL=1
MEQKKQEQPQKKGTHKNLHYRCCTNFHISIWIYNELPQDTNNDRMMLLKRAVV